MFQQFNRLRVTIPEFQAAATAFLGILGHSSRFFQEIFQKFQNFSRKKLKIPVFLVKKQKKSEIFLKSENFQNFREFFSDFFLQISGKSKKNLGNGSCFTVFFSISEVSGLFLSARAQKIGEKRGTGRQKIRRYNQERGISKSRDCYAEPGYKHLSYLASGQG